MEKPDETLNATASKPLIITREFNAPRQMVWDAWTQPENLKRWWGPKTFTCPVAKIDFNVGGKYLFCMQGPDGKKYWSTGIYKEINPIERLVFTDSFSDENGNIVSGAVYGMADMPDVLEVTIILEEKDGKTKMTLTHTGMPASEHGEMAGQGWNESFDKMAENFR